MKSRFYACVSGFALLALPQAASAQGITYDCDTAAAHFSELDLPAGAAPFTVSGNVKLNALAGSKEWVPLIRIQIASSAAPGESPDALGGFSLSALPVDPKKMPSGERAVQMLSWNAHGKEDEMLPMTMFTKPGTVQPFTLTYDGSNVSVTLGAEAKSFPLKTATPVVRIICSTGEFLLTDLVITPSR